MARISAAFPICPAMTRWWRDRLRTSRWMAAAVMATDIITLARGWIGTPYRHQASLKGVGCDCLGLLRGVWPELHGEEPEDVPPYSSDWSEATGAEALRDA